MTLYEAIEADKKSRMALATTTPSAHQMAEAQPSVIDITTMQCDQIKLAQATKNIEHLERKLQDLEYLFELENRRAEQFRHAGDVNKEAKAMKSIIGYRDQIHKVENQIIKEKLTIAKTQNIVFAY